MTPTAFNPSPIHYLSKRIIDDIVRSGVAPGENLENSRELADRYGVSTATINRAMRHLTREGWVERRAGKGTFRGPRLLSDDERRFSIQAESNSVRLMVAVLPLDFSLSNWHVHHLLQGIDMQAAVSDVSVELLGPCGGNNDLFAKRLEKSRPDVIAFLKPPISSAPILREVERLQIPALATGTRWRDFDISSVEEDGFGGARTAVESLIAAGHERIALFIPDSAGHLWIDRRRGYEAAMTAAWGDFDRNLIFLTRDEGGEIDLERVKRFLDRQRPTAAFVLDPEILSEPIHEGIIRVPEDLSVVCFDARYEYYEKIFGTRRPDLIDLPLQAMGQRVVELAGDIKNGKKITQRTIIPCAYIPGDTVQPRPKQAFCSQSGVSPSGKQAFTLIELLVVVTILALLAALSLGAVGRVTTLARQMQGLNVQKNILSAVHQYISDHDGLIPGPTDRSQYGATKRNSTQLSWYLADYLGIDKTAKDGTPVQVMLPPTFSSKYNPAQMAAYFAVNNIYTAKNVMIKPWGTTETKSWYISDDYRPKKFASIPDPSSHVALIDNDLSLGVSSTAVPSTPIYGTSYRNAAFWDGHAERVPLDYDLFPENK